MVSLSNMRKHPLHQLLSQPVRDVFFDAPLGNLNSSLVPNLSPIASGDYQVLVGWDGKTAVNDTNRPKITTQVEEAHNAGLLTWYWNTPFYPIYGRNAVFLVLLEQGSDLLNADGLKAAAGF